ncbi:hypothetical protein EMIHUDRAFT_449017 [Emiliania huxleyi CCMP1516]|uniref:Uncharacterized protein n=2 Tax=Emiliania huxleyi TaxID=2903 RepID=A0A0D3KQW8_EMIH1|nr:hypothetical protein EMIHUDRAFT_449017 [Emiliania huxleyi CCMP1516]EOD38153.1 hypothetical protein EMIHUDRAFT_449017 [Emiliania huxleyi CCMP1516]|eukprot:XP_005790582.1 hypothetical protein EMIHUDRAFT_449017 [Emiliania huxleyi CCMP1516]
MSGVGEPGGAVAAYGEFLGTACVAALFEIGFALLPPRLIGKVFPPIVCGVAITCIGASLTGAGIKYWGGGVFCMENDLSKLPLWKGLPQMCQNGDVDHLAAGAPEHVGMGFMVVCIMVLIEIFGAPFWKNANVVISLLLAYFISMGLSVTPPATEDDPNPEPHDYVNFRFTKLTAEETPIVFFWVRRFPLGFNASYLLPLILAFFVSTAETVGDIGATLDASELPSYGPDADTRPVLVACDAGLIGPVGGFFADIPYPIVGGMVTFLFANVMVSGIIVLSKLGIKRRNRIILSFSLGIALGPNFFEGGGSATFAGGWLKMNYGFWPLKRVCESGTEVYDLDKGPDWVISCEFNTGLKSLRQAVLLALKTPYSIGASATRGSSTPLALAAGDSRWQCLPCMSNGGCSWAVGRY